MRTGERGESPPPARCATIGDVKHAAIQRAFEAFLAQRALRLTPQRERIFKRVFETHEHFSAETLYSWLREEDGPKVSRATVYRTIGLLVEGHFVESLDTGASELLYEHTLGHAHHDHLVCTECGRIEEFSDERIEALQEQIAEAKGFRLRHHSMRLFGTCSACTRKRAATKSEAPSTA